MTGNEGLKKIIESLPTELRDELNIVTYNTVTTQTGELKFKNKSYNHSNKQSNLLSTEKYLDYLHSKYRKILRGYEHKEVFDDEDSVFALLSAMQVQQKEAGAAKSDPASAVKANNFIIWSAASGTKIETVRSMRYWQLNVQDVKLLRYIKTAVAGEKFSGKLITYVRCDLDSETYVMLAPVSNIRHTDIVNVLAATMVSEKESLYNLLEREYVEFIETRYRAKNDFDGCCLGAISLELQEDAGYEYCAYTFPDYLRAAVKHLTDMELRLEKEPVAISAKRDEPCFFYFDRDEVKKHLKTKCETPHWDSWMQVIPDEFHEVFKAWVYSIFVPQNKGRQALWLHSEGYDGKSQVSTALTRYMKGQGVGSINTKTVKSQFAYSAAYGRRLLIFGDCQNSKFLKTNEAHSILGGDLAPVEFKNKDTFSARVFCKLFICSNKHPEIDVNASHEISRVIYIPLQLPSKEIRARFLKTDAKGEIIYDNKLNPIHLGYNAKEKGKELNDYLLDEMDKFLCKCRSSYLDLCPNHKEIEVSNGVRDALYSVCASETSETYERYILDNYEFCGNVDAMEDVLDIKQRAHEHFGSPEMQRSFKEFRIEDLLSSLEKIAKRALIKNGTPVKVFHVELLVDEDFRRVYRHMKYVGDQQAAGVSLT